MVGLSLPNVLTVCEKHSYRVGPFDVVYPADNSVVAITKTTSEMEDHGPSIKPLKHKYNHGYVHQHNADINVITLNLFEILDEIGLFFHKACLFL